MCKLHQKEQKEIDTKIPYNLHMERGVNMITVCYNCAERHVGCHSQCPKYIEDKAHHEQLQNKIRQSRLVDAGIVCSRLNRYKRRVAHYKQKEV